MRISLCEEEIAAIGLYLIGIYILFEMILYMFTLWPGKIWALCWAMILMNSCQAGRLPINSWILVPAPLVLVVIHVVWEIKNNIPFSVLEVVVAGIAVANGCILSGSVLLLVAFADVRW